jgi:hypothetical protein
MRTIMADDDMQRVKDIIGHVEQAAIMTDKGMSADQIVGPKLFDGILKWNLV